MKAYTDIKQSKKLAEILPLESADMSWVSNGLGKPFARTIPIKGDPEELFACWSLAALLSVIKPVNDNTYALIGTLDGGAMISFEEVTNVTFQEEEIIDAVFEMILKLHELKLL